jgi:glutamate 5-kinase
LEKDVLIRISKGEKIGTLLSTDLGRITARKQWLAGQPKLAGVLALDEGAIQVLQKGGKSLLAVGVTGVQGQFNRGEIVSCVNTNGKEIARGLINYSADETRKIMKHPSTKIESLLGYINEDELIHRDNLILV